MSDVRGYVAGQTGTLSDVLEHAPDLAPVTPAGPDGFKAPPSFGEMFHAARPAALQATSAYDDAKIGEGYAPIVDALGLPASENPGFFGNLDAAGEARFGFAGSPSNLATAARRGVKVPFGSNYLADRATQESLIIDQIHARRAKDPNFLPGVPDTAEGLHAYFEAEQAKKRAAGAAVLARGSTFGRTVAGVAAGGLESARADPIQFGALLVGGGTAETVLQAAGRDALINGVLSAGQLPIEAHNMAENGEHLTVGEAAGQVLGSTAFGAVLGGTVHVAAAHVPPALFKIMPESVQTRWAGRMRVGDGKNAPLLTDVLGDMDNRELAGFARSTIGDRMTPDEKGAADALERSQELGEASPFEPGPIGDAAHNAGLAEALKSVIDGVPRETTPGSLLSSTSTIGLRSPEPVPAGADFDAQWSAIKGNEHGLGPHGEFLTSRKGAVGPGQVMPGTAPYAAKLAGLPWDEARYRGDAAYNEAIGRAYYAEQLRTFGDPDMAAAAYNAGPGSAERGTGLRGALRKAAEHGEPGNWEAYLPRETQRYVEDFRRRNGSTDRGAMPAAEGVGDDELAALQRSADEAEAEGLSLSRDRERLDADLGGDRADVADVPVLKRDLFGDDQSWADAQAAFHQSLNAPEEAAGRPLSAETGAEAPEQRAAQNAPGEVGAPITVQTYVDAYLRGEGRGDSPRDRELLQFATNNGPAIEAEFNRRASIKKPFNQAAAKASAKAEHVHIDAHEQDGLIYLNAVERLDGSVSGSGAKAIRAILEEADRIGLPVALRASAPGDPRPPRRLVDYYRQFGFEQGASDSAEMFRPARERAARGGVADQVRIDDPALKAFEQPGGQGSLELADSLEHDARIAAVDPVLGKRSYQLDAAGKPVTLTEILAKLDADSAAVAELRACAGAGA